MVNAQPNRNYHNAIEPLVVQELQRQIQTLTPTVVENLALEDVIAYALNSLPPLYATTTSGWQSQQIKAKQQLQRLIANAVRQGLMVVYQSPKQTPVRLVPHPRLGSGLAPVPLYRGGKASKSTLER